MPGQEIRALYHSSQVEATETLRATVVGHCWVVHAAADAPIVADNPVDRREQVQPSRDVRRVRRIGGRRRRASNHLEVLVFFPTSACPLVPHPSRVRLALHLVPAKE